MSIPSTELVLASQIQPPHPQPDGRSIIGRVLDKVGAWLAGSGSTELVGAGPVALNYGHWITADPYQTATLPAVTETTALGIPAFGRGVELIASKLAGIDLMSYRYNRETHVDDRLDPQPAILADPDLLGTPWGWKFAMVSELILYGNYFAELGDPDSTGWPSWLRPIDATRVALGVDQDTKQLAWLIDGRRVVAWGSLFHVSAGNRPGRILGRGMIRQYHDALQGQLAVERSASKYHAAGGMPAGILQSSNPDLSQSTADSMKAKYRATVGAGSREPLVLPASWTFTPVVTDADKQQMIESRKWDANTAAMILGIPPSKLGLDGGPSMTYSNSEMDDLRFASDTLDRWAQPIAAAVTKWLLPQGQRAAWNYAARYRVDRKTRAEALKLEIDTGLSTLDEARQEVGKPPIEAPAGPSPDTTPEVSL